jgi:hypothetical protein
MQWEYYVVYRVAVQIEYMAAFEDIQELICLKGVLLIEMGIHLVDPITFMDVVKSAMTFENTRMDEGGTISILNTVSRGHSSR